MNRRFGRVFLVTGILVFFLATAILWFRGAIREKRIDALIDTTLAVMSGRIDLNPETYEALNMAPGLEKDEVVEELFVRAAELDPEYSNGYYLAGVYRLSTNCARAVNYLTLHKRFDIHDQRAEMILNRISADGTCERVAKVGMNFAFATPGEVIELLAATDPIGASTGPDTRPQAPLPAHDTEHRVVH